MGLKYFKKKYIFIFLVIILILGGFFIYKTKQQPNHGKYITGTVEVGNISSVINATGTINPVHYVDVSTNVPGELAQVYVKANDQVSQGQIIATIDDRQLKAIAHSAKATLDNTKREYLRYEELLKQGAVAQQVYDNAKTSYEKALADYQRAVANVEDTVITAPMAGTVIGTPLQAGQTISTGMSTQMIICTIADLRDLEIYVNVDETDIGAVKTGAKVEFSVDAYPGKVYTGTVKKIVLGNKGSLGTVSNNVVYYSVRVAIPKEGVQDFLPGMTARATIYGQEAKNTLMVPLAAVRTDKMGEYVYVIKNGEPTRVSVVTGITGASSIQIVKGLEAGEEIVVSGDIQETTKKTARAGHPGV